jgi:hypothetical protein
MLFPTDCGFWWHLITKFNHASLHIPNGWSRNISSPDSLHGSIHYSTVIETCCGMTTQPKTVNFTPFQRFCIAWSLLPYVTARQIRNGPQTGLSDSHTDWIRFKTVVCLYYRTNYSVSANLQPTSSLTALMKPTTPPSLYVGIMTVLNILEILVNNILFSFSVDNLTIQFI